MQLPQIAATIEAMDQQIEPNRLTTARAVIGTAADVEDLDTGVHSHFEFVSSAESNPARGRLSVESPVGRALAGCRPGDTVEVQTPKGPRRLKLLAIQRT